jgi:DNA polymerase-1
MFEHENTEADDLINVVARRMAEQGHDVVIVTADRDFFQLVGPHIKLMMNRRGISDTVIYDEAAVRQRYGFGPKQYLEYAALRGDPSDNIEGVPGVGEKTASKLIITHGTLEGVFESLDELTPKLRENLAAAKDRLFENREFFRFRETSDLEKTSVPKGALDVNGDDLRMGEWDLIQIRKLFDTLEFKTLYERLTEELNVEVPSGEGFTEEPTPITSAPELNKLASSIKADPVVFRVNGDPSNLRKPPTGFSMMTEDGPRYVVVDKGLAKDQIWPVMSKALAKAKVITHGAKEATLRMTAVDVKVGEFVMDTEIAAYLVDPARGDYSLAELSKEWLGRELKAHEPAGEGQGSLLDASEDEATESSIGLEAVAVSELAPILENELKDRGAWDLFVDLELPLSQVLAKMEGHGVRIDVKYLGEMASLMSDQLAHIEDEIYRHAGGPFNINSPPQLREVLFERLGLKPTKKTKTGYSTDAGVLESLRDEHPIVDGILRYRERSKLKSTYVDSLPRLVDPETGRLHCRFNQTVASTGRLSSDSPNLQNIPIRTEEGRQIRKAFIPEKGYTLLKADYSQIELRILAHLSEDPELTAAFDRGDDIHVLSIAKALGLETDEVTPELRSIGKMVSYGVTYGMGPFGLSQRLKIPVDQAKTYIDGFFGLYPRVRGYLDEVVDRAAVEGFTTTLLGRRRYLPELKSRNPRLKSLGERMALNAPIQGSAADVMKLAMVEADRKVPAEAHMVMTVHDELVFEVRKDDVEDVAEAVVGAMESVIDLKVPLIVDVAWGPNWNDTTSP